MILSSILGAVLGGLIGAGVVLWMVAASLLGAFSR